MRKFFSVLSTSLMAMALSVSTSASTVAPLTRGHATKANPVEMVKPDSKPVPARMVTSKASLRAEKDSPIRSINRLSGNPFNNLKPMSAPHRVMGSANIVACGVYSETLDVPAIYSIPEFETLAAGVEVNAGTVTGTKYVGTYLYTFWGYIMGAYIFEYDSTDWSLIQKKELSTDDLSTMAASLAADPADGLIYGCFYNTDGDGYEFATLDPETLVRSEAICTLEGRMSSLSFDADGTLYCIDSEGNLSTVDKTTGALTFVSSTGLASKYSTSGVIDPKTGIYYYATSNDDGENFYGIDLKNGYTVEDFGALAAEVTGMAIGAPLAADGAPGFIEDFAVTFTGNSLTGDVTMTLPATTFDGQPMTGDVTYVVMCGSDPVALNVGQAGATVTETVTMTESGTYSFRAFALNEVGNGPKTDPVTLWVGTDIPSTPENVEATFADGTLSVSWDAVTTSVHGGYFEAANVTYTVTRDINGEEVTVATGLTDLNWTESYTEPTAITTIFYNVVAVADDVASEAGKSNVISLGFLTPPYNQSFETADDVAGYTIVDANGDGKSWQWNNGKMRMSYSSSADMDDWLILPGAKLEGGKAYEFSIVVNSQSNYYPERFEVKFGNAATAEAMTVEVIPATDVLTANPTTYTGMVNVAENGIYYFGVHGISDADMYYLFVDDIAISAPFSTGAPGCVTNVKFGAQYDGSDALDISFNAPTVTIGGDPLTSIDLLAVMRDGTAVQTFENPAPGEALSFKDTADKGDYMYSFVAVNAEGIGKTYYESAHVGIALAAAPVDVTVVESYNNPGYVTIDWTAVTTDVNGTELDPSLITYTILNDDQEVVAEGIPSTEPTYGYQAVAAGEDQKFMAWFIIPVTDAGYNTSSGGYGVTDLIAVGTPYDMPMMESVEGGQLSNIWGVSGSGWGIASEVDVPACTPQDEDGGMFYYNGQAAGNEASIFSGKVNVEEAENVGFQFYYFPTDDDAYEFMPYVMIAGYSYDLLPEWVSTKVADGATAEWTRVFVPLVDYCGFAVQVGIKARCVNYTAIFCVDNIAVANFVDYDLGISDFNAPKTIKMGTDGVINVTVTNYGTKDAGAYTVDLLLNGEVVETSSQDGLATGRSANITFTQTPDLFWDPEVTYQARINFPEDEQTENNASINLTVIIAEPSLPAVEDLTAERSGNDVVLTWTDPDTSASAEEVTDGVEDYEAFAINDAGDWTFIDVDQSGTYGFSGLSFPNAYSAMAFMVFDQSEIGLDTMAHSGDKVFADFASTSGNNDDWMISPELAGCAQTVSFYAKSYTTQYGAESFEFYYSTGSPAIDDMVLLQEVPEVPEDWTEYTFDLPEGAMYFAIRCVSEDRFIFLVDDITFTVGTPALELLNYDIYRDGELIAQGVEGNTYQDLGVDSETEHVYHVVANYSTGYSGLSNPAVAESSSIDAITVGNGADAIYYNIQGVRVDKPAPGTVVIKVVGTEAKKVIVR